MTLSELIPQYYEHKTELDKQKKIVDAENNDIKREMEKQDITECDVAGLHAKYIVQKRESMDEEKLLKVIKKFWSKNGSMTCPYIKTKEYVDMDALENALYHNEIDTDTIIEMDKCKEVKEVIQLKVTKKKGDN